MTQTSKLIVLTYSRQQLFYSENSNSLLSLCFLSISSWYKQETIPCFHFEGH